MTTSHELPRQYGSLLDLSGRTRRPARRIVAVCTGRGMKAPDTITRAMPCPTGIPARLEALEVVS